MNAPTRTHVTTRLAAARHEAAHAVVAETVGIRVTRVVLCDDKTGYCEYDRRQGMQAINRATVAMAGTAAELLWHDMPEGWISSGDAEVMLQSGFSEHDFAPAMFLANSVIKRRQEAIWRVADELMRLGKLTGKQVRELIGGDRG